MIAALFRLVLFAFVLYLAFLSIRIFRLLTRPKRPSTGSRELRGVMVKDEICNTYIPKEEALREVRDGKEHFFCSKECRLKFLERGASPPPPG
jgi:YHS domain-containing protein